MTTHATHALLHRVRPRYNLRRKVAGLPQVTREWFEARKAQLASAQAQGALAAVPAGALGTCCLHPPACTCVCPRRREHAPQVIASALHPLLPALGELPSDTPPAPTRAPRRAREAVAGPAHAQDLPVGADVPGAHAVAQVRGPGAQEWPGRARAPGGAQAAAGGAGGRWVGGGREGGRQALAVHEWRRCRGREVGAGAREGGVGRGAGRSTCPAGAQVNAGGRWAWVARWAGKGLMAQKLKRPRGPPRPCLLPTKSLWILHHPALLTSRLPCPCARSCR